MFMSKETVKNGTHTNIFQNWEGTYSLRITKLFVQAFLMFIKELEISSLLKDSMEDSIFLKFILDIVIFSMGSFW